MKKLIFDEELLEYLEDSPKYENSHCPCARILVEDMTLERDYLGDVLYKAGTVVCPELCRESINNFGNLFRCYIEPQPLQFNTSGLAEIVCAFGRKLSIRSEDFNPK